MFGLLESKVKIAILVCLGLRGGVSGRQLARLLHKSPTQIFKALNSLEKGKIIVRCDAPPFFALNSENPYYDEIVRLIHKTYENHPSQFSFLPRIKRERQVDPISIYKIAALRDNKIKIEKFSDVLRKRYA